MIGCDCDLSMHEWRMEVKDDYYSVWSRLNEALAQGINVSSPEC